MSRLKRKLPPADPGQPATWEVSCIDRLEFPGGGVPTVNVDLGTARGLCAAKKKRLCTRSEWRRGCGGKYPYGAEFEQDRCHLVSDSGGGQSPVATGSKTGCRSPLGLADMVGNVAEWTVDGSVNGGSSLKDGENATCDLTSRRAGGAPHIGFRCCADPVR
jgi:formylglycine-generating enzyme required for sulfatase activity